jgi:hypothetical protein
MTQTRTQLVKGFSNTSASADAITVDSSGDVGIGATVPDRLLHLKAASSTAYSGGSDTADYNFLKIENTTDNKSAGVFFLIGGNGEAAITATEVSDGNTDIAFQNRGGGVRSEKMRMLAGGGLTFNGDTAAANALDDYEEGTFTGRFNNQDDDATVSHGNQTGFYVKVGNLVHFSLYFDDIDVSSTGSINRANIFGLPFTSLGTAQHYSVVNIIHNTILTSAAGGYVNTNSTRIFPTDVGTTDTSTFSTGTNFRLMVGGTYRAA